MGRRKSQAKKEKWEAEKAARAATQYEAAVAAAKPNIDAFVKAVSAPPPAIDADYVRPSELPWNMPNSRWVKMSKEEQAAYLKKSKLAGAPKVRITVPKDATAKYNMDWTDFKKLKKQYQTAILAYDMDLRKPGNLKKGHSGSAHLVTIKQKDGTIKAFPCRKTTEADIKAGFKKVTCRTRLPKL